MKHLSQIFPVKIDVLYAIPSINYMGYQPKQFQLYKKLNSWNCTVGDQVRGYFHLVVNTFIKLPKLAILPWGALQRFVQIFAIEKTAGFVLENIVKAMYPLRRKGYMA